MDNDELRKTGQKYVNADLPIIPVHGKQPIIPSWKEFQNRTTTEEELNDWCDKSNITGLALVCGNGVSVLDFDDINCYDKWLKIVGRILEDLPLQKSGKGYHVAFRSNKQFTKGKLAMINNGSGYATGIETIGTGGYVLVAPSLHMDKSGKFDCQYQAERGNFYNLPLITDDHADKLVEAAKSLDQRPAPAPKAYSDNAESKRTPEVVDRFNSTIAIAEILLRNGYQQDPHDLTKFRSPSATSPEETFGVLINTDDNTCFSFHQNDDLAGVQHGPNGEELHIRYNAFNAFRILEHGGEYGPAYTAAEKELGLNTFSYEPKEVSGLPRLINYDIMATEFPPLKFIVPKYLPEGLFILAGKQKLGKSWLALDMSLAVATGGTVLNEQVEQGRSIYFALEDGARRLQDRLMKLGLGNKQPELLTLGEMGSLNPLDDGGYAQIKGILEHYTDTRLMIIDTLGMIKPKSQHRYDYDEAVRELSPLRDLANKHGIALVLVTHVRKSEADDTFDEVHGSVGITGTADGTIKLSRKRGKTTATMDITGRDIEEVSLAIELDKSTFKWNVLGDAFTHDVTEEQKKVLDAINKSATGSMSPSEIARVLDKSKQSAGQLLGRMLEKEILTNSKGSYSINPNRFGIAGVGIDA